MRAVRLAEAMSGDLDDLVRLDQHCFLVADRFSQKTWRHLLGVATRRRTALVVTARAHGRLLGAAAGLFRAGSRVARIYSIAVDPEARGLGLGAKLIAEIAARAPRRCGIVSLEVRADNPARALYEKLGMRAAGELPGYYADGVVGMRYRGERKELLRRAGR